MDRYDKLINYMKKENLAQNLMYALTQQFVDRMEKSRKINSEEN